MPRDIAERARIVGSEDEFRIPQPNCRTHLPLALARRENDPNCLRNVLLTGGGTNVGKQLLQLLDLSGF